MVDRVLKRERLMNLVAVLLASAEPIPFREIAGRVVGYDDSAGGEALEKRFDRDKADLRRLGIPVEYTPGDDGRRAGYVIPRDQVFQQQVSFTPQEAMLLTIAGRVGAAATGGGALEDALKSALRKLAVDLIGSDPLEELGDVTVLRACSGDPQAVDNVSRLAGAVTGNRRIRFSYRSIGSGARTLRDVDPFGLGLWRGAWYLVGHCHLRGEVRVFKVARIDGRVQPAGSPEGAVFQVPADFRLEDHLGREAWDFGDGSPVTVRLRVASSVGGIDAIPGAREVTQDAAATTVDVEVRRPEALLTWILSHGGEVSVVAPQALRERVANEARRLLECYEAAVLPLLSRDVATPAVLAAGEEPA